MSAPPGLDVRTRVDGDLRGVDPEVFFGAELPAAFDAAAAGIEQATRWMSPAPLTIEVGGGAWTLERGERGLSVRAGAHAPARLTLRPEDLDELVADLVTPMAWLISGTLRSTTRLEHLLDWWVLLRAALDRREAYAPGAGRIDFEGLAGTPLDLARSFRVDDDPEELAHFLATAGYLHLEGVFSDEEMAQVSADMDLAAPGYSPDDGRSWWARTNEGENRLVRMQGFDQHSATLRDLLEQDRFVGIGALGRSGHEFGDFGPNRVEALVKPLGIVEGISDVPWHKDCANGRHSYDCCGLTVGVSITGADAESGQLRVVAGSHRALVWPAFVRQGQDLPLIDLPTRTGDVTVHLSCTTHMAQPPVTRERRVLYTAFALPAADPEAQRIGKARLRRARESAPTTVSQPPAR